jgi:phage-related minor tail protein
MALLAGELNAIMTIDDRAVAPALRRAERAMQTTGRRIGDDAEDAGRRAGQQLGDGLADGAGDGAEAAVGGIGEKLAGLPGLVLGIGTAAGAMLMSAFSDAMEQGRITAKLGAQLGTTPAVAQRYGKVAGALFKDAIVGDFQEGADTINAIASAGLFKPNATNAQINSLAANAADLANAFDIDVTQAAQAAGSMLKNGMAKDGKQAFDLLTKGMTGLGPASDDLVDTFTEYGPIFKAAGLSGQTALGLIRQAIQGGWTKDTDKIADAFKEFGIRGTEGSKAVQQAFQSLGLDAKKTGDDIAAGGKRGEKAMDTVLDKLRDLGPNSAQARQIVSTLFGGPGEDLGAALFALDVDKASAAMGSAAGEADKLGNSMRDNAATKIEAFKRGLQQNVVEFIGGTVLPKFTELRGAIGHIWDDAGKGGTAGADRVIAFFGIIGQRLMDKARELAPKFVSGLSQAGQKVAEFITSNPEQALKLSLIAGAIAAAIALLPVLIAGAIAASASLIVVGFTRKLISATNENLPKWLASFGNWLNAQTAKIPGFFNGIGTAIGGWFGGLWSRYIAGPVGRQWNSFLASVRALPGRAVAALSALAPSLTGVSARSWAQFASAASAKASSFIGWVRGLPGRISSGVGSLGSLLYRHGQQVVQGLWSGISSMGGWLRSTLIGWAKSAIPGPIAKALGIASPSKVTAAQGRWIARGLVAGLTGSQKQVKAASYKLADIVRDALSGKRERAAIKRINKDSNRLAALAGWDAKVGSQLKAARKKVADLQKARDKLSSDVKNGVLSEANITQQDSGGWAQTADSILAGLRADTQAAQRFAANLATLRKKGVRSDLIAQIAQAGVTQGSGSAAALASANASQVKAINSQQSALVKAAGAAGATAGDAMYGAGIRAAQGLVKGLTGQQKAIEATMLRIAKGMTKAIRAALGIKSPSRVMALVGQYTAQGLVKGLDGEQRAVNRSMAGLVETPAAGSWDMASGRARAAAAQKVVVEFRGSTRGEDAYVLSKMRRSVRRVSGGDVQFAVGGRRT